MTRRALSISPWEQVVDDLSHMGFSRDAIRGEVRRMNDSGQAVDLNTIIDRLMNRS